MSLLDIAAAIALFACLAALYLLGPIIGPIPVTVAIVLIAAGTLIAAVRESRQDEPSS